MSGAIASFSSMAIAGRILGDRFDTFEIMLVRSLIGLLILSLILSASGRWSEIRTHAFGLHVFRNLFHFAGQNLWFYALTVIPLAQVFALEFTSPIWIILLAPFVLKERVTWVGAISALLGFAGVLIVTRPGSIPFNIGFVAAAGAAIGFAMTALLTRKLTRTETILTILLWLTALQAVFGMICAGLDGDILFPSMRELPYFILIGCAGLLAHFCMTNALALAPASFVMPIDFIRLPVIAIIAATFFGEPFDIYVFIGAIVIFAANYLNIMFGQKAAGVSEK